MKRQYLKINEDLYLNSFIKEAEVKNVVVDVKPAVDHIIVIDCSGSMSSELPKIRTQLKNKLSSLVKEEDTVSIVWFSSRNECGILKEKVKINNVNDLLDLQKAIDRFLVPVGLTGFVDPLKMVKTIVSADKKRVSSMLFLTDGYDNQSSKQDIIKAVTELSELVDNSVIVEFGYWCNRPLMMEMAEKLGGQLIFSENFNNYEPVFESYMTGNVKSTKKVEFNVGNALFNIAFATDSEGDIFTFEVVDGLVHVSEDYDFLHTLASAPQGNSVPENVYDLYLPLYILAQRNKAKEVYSLLKKLGDVKLIKSFQNAFGKQAVYNFCDEVKAIIKDNSNAFELGSDVNLVPPDDAFCVLDLFEELDEHETKWYPKHKLFDYKTIGAARVQKVEVDVDLQNEIAALQAQIAKKPTPDAIKLLQEKLTLLGDSVEELKFEYRDENPEAKFSDIVWNETRPNVSFRVMYHGSVKVPNNTFGIDVVPTYKYNNYTFVRDGILNVKQFVVSLNDELFAKYSQIEGFVTKLEDGLTLINLTKLPLVNRKMVTEASAEDLFRKSYELKQLQANAKVLSYYDKKENPKTSKSFAEAYGVDGAAWLKEIGLTDFNGFSPKTVAEKIGESYFSNELEVKLAKLSSLPAVDKVNEKVTAKGVKSLTLSEQLIYDGINFYNSNLALITDSEILKNVTKKVIDKKRKVGTEIAKTKFAVLISQTWFKEFSSMDEGKMTLDMGGVSVDCEVVSREKEIEI